jgi:hypothetical protein
MDLNDNGAGSRRGRRRRRGRSRCSGSAADILGVGNDAGADGAGGAGDGGAGEGSANGAGVADPDFYAQLSADGEGDEASLRDWAKSAGVKDANHMAKLLRENMKAVRDSGRVKVPGEGASDTEIADFRKAIGVPEKADGYALPALKDADGNDVPMNSEKLGRIAEIAHKHGIPKSALEATLQEIAQGDANELAGEENELKAKAAAHAKSWGAERAAKLDAVDLGGKHLELDKSQLLSLRRALGPEKALDLLAKVGSGLREDTLLDGGNRRGFAGDPVAAQARLDEIKTTPELAAKARVPGSAINTEYNRLLGIVGEAENRKAAQNG